MYPFIEIEKKKSIVMVKNPNHSINFTSLNNHL